MAGGTPQRPSLASVLASLVVGLASQRAAAGEPAAPKGIDPLIVPGAVVTSAGVASTIAGAMLSAAAPGENVCGFNGCFRREVRAWYVASGALLGAGFPLTLLGAPTLLVGIGRTTPDDAHLGATQRKVGIGLLSAGVAMMGAGIGVIAMDGARYGFSMREVGLGLSGLLVGPGLVITGGVLWGRAGSRPEPLPYGGPAAHPSKGMINAGITCTVVGVAATAAGAIMIAIFASQEGHSGGPAVARIGVPVTAGGVILTVVGGVLLGVSRRAAPAPQSLHVPSVRLGPANLDLTWRF